MSSSFNAYVDQVFPLLGDSGPHNHGGAVGAAETRMTFENVCDFGLLFFCGRHTVSSLRVMH